MQKKLNKEALKKISSIITALTMSSSVGGNLLNVSAEENLDDNVNIEQKEYSAKHDIMISIYNKQMNYLIPTINKLNDFYNNVDTKDIIKTEFSDAYGVINEKLDYYEIYGGYVPVDGNYERDVIRNNNLIKKLDINMYHHGSPINYGRMFKLNRSKTEEDKDLINNYNSIVNNSFDLYSNLIDYISLDDNELNEEKLFEILKVLYSKQINSIVNNRENLKEFYSNSNYVEYMKQHFENAYNSYSMDLNYTQLFNMYMPNIILDNNNVDNINTLFEEYKKSLLVLNGFKIQPVGNGRDPDYGIIFDKNEEMGFRRKTDEDKEIINEYSSKIMGIDSVYNSFYQLINIQYNNLSNKNVKSK